MEDPGNKIKYLAKPLTFIALNILLQVIATVVWDMRAGIVSTYSFAVFFTLTAFIYAWLLQAHLPKRLQMWVMAVPVALQPPFLFIGFYIRNSSNSTGMAEALSLLGHLYGGVFMCYAVAAASAYGLVKIFDILCKTGYRKRTLTCISVALFVSLVFGISTGFQAVLHNTHSESTCGDDC